MKKWLRLLQPGRFEDLVAMNALYRPGPMDFIPDFIARKHGTRFAYPHPCLEPVLANTYGIMVYQEQVMRIASDIGGFTLAKADLMRRAMGKKDKKIMDDLKAEFIDGAIEAGLKETGAEFIDHVKRAAKNVQRYILVLPLPILFILYILLDPIRRFVCHAPHA